LLRIGKSKRLLSNPMNSPQTSTSGFEQFGLQDELLSALKTKGYKKPTPIQIKAIPVVLQGRDILASAQTGTGKTEAFALPLVDILSRQKNTGRHPRALVLAPTRELALQIGECIKTYTRRLSMRCTVVHGGVRIHPQTQRLRRGVHVLVATPGRLLDLAGHGYVTLSQIRFVIFDEADRMLDLGFSEEISRILDLLPVERHAMLFSATYTRAIRNLAKTLLNKPKFIEVTPGHTPADPIAQKVCLVDRSNKRELLLHLINRGQWPRVLVFCRTKQGAHKLTQKLVAQKLNAAVLHGSKGQSVRIRLLEDFKRGKIRILVATDVAARGLDIIQLPLVINYDIPRSPQDYIHRIGRTGRASERGVAISLVSQDEKPYLQAIEKWQNQKIPVETVDGYTTDSDVPDFVLLRPSSAASEQKAALDIKALVARRNTSKKNKKARKAKSTGTGKSSKPKSNPLPKRKRVKPEIKRPLSATRTSKSSNSVRPRGKR
jgi:ATP-dependent RNA helicase RhlE